MAALELDATQAVGEAGHDGAEEDDVDPGEHVGEYIVERRLGAGAFGAVYRARHPILGRDVAIKILHRSVSSNEEIVGRFLAEARAVNQIRHRNIIDVSGFGQLPDGRHYYVMECLDGEPLDALLARRGSLPPAEALPLLRGIAKALDAAHDQGIVHRDLKAENVFLVREGTETFPKLLDFGIAKLISSEQGALSRTRSGIQIGTPYAMAPEQCRGVAVDGRADVYALGVLIHRMLTGAYLFDGETAMDVIMKHMTAKPPAMSTVARSLPSALDKPVLKMLAKEPSDRFARPSEGVEALADAMARAGLVDAGARSSAITAATTGAPRATLRSAVLASVGGQPRVFGPALTALAAAALATAWWRYPTERTPTVESAALQAPVLAPPTAASETPASFEVRIGVTPPSARLTIDGEDAGTGSVTITRPRGAVVHASAEAPGHVAHSERIVVDSAVRLEWALEVNEAPRPTSLPRPPSTSPRVPKKRDRAVHSDLVNPLD